MCLAVPGRIIDTHDDRGTPMATMDFDGIRKEVCLAFLPEVGIGDFAIVHVGFAISQVDESSALETLALFREMGVLDAEPDDAEPDDAEPDDAEPDDAEPDDAEQEDPE